MQPKPQEEPHLTSWNDFCRLVLEIIAELSPCPEPTLFVVAATRGLQRFAGGSLEDLGKLLRKCLQELKSRGLVEIKGEQLVIPTPGGRGDEPILDRTAGLEFRPQSLKEKPAGRAGEDILQLTAELELQPQSVREKSTKPAADEDILNLTAQLELADDDILNLTPQLEFHEDLLQLTAELETHPYLLLSKDKAPQEQPLKTPAPGMARPKGGAEPTREEIIAAMRRFISDD